MAVAVPQPSGPAAVRRLGIFGGAFDPPHQAHRALAQAATAQLQLDQLRIFPTGQAWHKTRPLSAAPHRLAMARLAFADIPGVVVDARELERPGPTYTVDTLRELQAEYANAALFLLMGADQAATLPHWQAWQEILESATICIAERALPTASDSLFDASQYTSQYPHARLKMLQLPAQNLSATTIRSQVAALQNVDHWLPQGVARYIDQHHLYTPAR